MVERRKGVRPSTVCVRANTSENVSEAKQGVSSSLTPSSSRRRQLSVRERLEIRRQHSEAAAVAVAAAAAVASIEPEHATTQSKPDSHLHRPRPAIFARSPLLFGSAGASNASSIKPTIPSQQGGRDSRMKPQDSIWAPLSANNWSEKDFNRTGADFARRARSKDSHGAANSSLWVPPHLALPPPQSSKTDRDDQETRQLAAHLQCRFQQRNGDVRARRRIANFRGFGLCPVAQSPPKTQEGSEENERDSRAFFHSPLPTSSLQDKKSFELSPIVLKDRLGRS